MPFRPNFKPDNTESTVEDSRILESIFGEARCDEWSPRKYHGC